MRGAPSLGRRAPSGVRLLEASSLPGRRAGCRRFTASLKESSLTPTDTDFHPVRLLTLNSAQEENMFPLEQKGERDK